MAKTILSKTLWALFLVVIITAIGMISFLVLRPFLRSQFKIGTKIFSIVATTKDELLNSLQKSANLKIVSPQDEDVFQEKSEITVTLKPRALYEFSEITIGFRDGEVVIPAVTEKISELEYKVKLPDRLGIIILQVAGKNQFDKIEITEVAVEAETSAVLLQVIPAPAKLSFNTFPAEQALQIKGFYDDSKSRDITLASTGTKYVVKSWKDNVVKVSKNGVVAVVGSGQDAITVTAGSRVIEIPVEVNITNYAPSLRLLVSDVARRVKQDYDSKLKLLTGETERKIKAGDVLDVEIEAVDQDQDDKVILTSDGLPSFMTFTDNGNRTGVLHLAPKIEDIGLYEKMFIIATDNGSPVLSDKKEFSIEVLSIEGESAPQNPPPVLP